jgi:predicted RNA-binding protein YlxR (DUF448 family)
MFILGRKHIPQRTCVACRQVRSKRELIRIVRISEGHVEIDETGKKSGRGAYLCRLAPCWEIALEKGALGRALKMPLTSEQKEHLKAFVGSLPEEPTVEEVER